MNNTLTPRKLSVLIATLLGVSLLPAQATLLNYNILTNSGYKHAQDESISNENNDQSPVSSYVSDSYWSSATTSDGAAAGNDQGWMYSRSRGEGAYYHHYSSVTQVVDLLNDTGVMQNYSYDFRINFGSLTASNYDFSTAEEFSVAGYMVDILLNGSSIWHSMYTLTNNLADGFTATASGTNLVNYTDGSSYASWGEYASTLNLGLLGAGDSLNLSYSIKTFVKGNHLQGCGGGQVPTAVNQLQNNNDAFSTNAIAEDCYGDYGYGGYGYYGFTGYSYAQFGDPNGFSSEPVAFNDQNIRISSVPEPAPLLLAGLGLAGLAFRRRRQS
jgi:hypothetical protein